MPSIPELEEKRIQQFSFLDMQVSLAPSPTSVSLSVRKSITLSDFHSVSRADSAEKADSALTKRRGEIVVADMVADMAADMEVHMVASMVADMVADRVADI